MTLQEMVREKNMTRYQLSQRSGIPWATLSDIWTGKTRLERCSGGTLVKPVSYTHLDVYKRQVLFENHSQDGRYRGPLEVTPTLQASCGMGGNNQPFCVEAPAYGISGTVIGRGPENGGNGAGVSLEVGYTLTARDRHGVCVPYQRVVGTLCSGCLLYTSRCV